MAGEGCMAVVHSSPLTGPHSSTASSVATPVPHGAVARVATPVRAGGGTPSGSRGDSLAPGEAARGLSPLDRTLLISTDTSLQLQCLMLQGQLLCTDMPFHPKESDQEVFLLGL